MTIHANHGEGIDVSRPETATGPMPSPEIRPIGCSQAGGHRWPAGADACIYCGQSYEDLNWLGPILARAGQPPKGTT